MKKLIEAKMYLPNQNERNSEDVLKDKKASAAKADSRFVSLKWKVVLVVSFVLLLVNGFIALFTYNSLNEQFERQQLDLRESLKRENTYQIESVFKRLTDFGELLPLLSNQNLDLTQVSKAIGNHFANFQINFDIRSVRLLSHRNMLVDTWGENLNVSTDKLFNQVKATQSPARSIHCQQQCLFLLASPLLDAQGNTAVLIVTQTVADWLLNLKIARGIDAGILSFSSVSIDSNASQGGIAKAIIHLTNKETNQSVLENLASNSSLKNALVEDRFVEQGNKTYSIQLLPLEQYTQSSEDFLVLIKDISQSRAEIKQGVFQAIMVSIIGMLATALFIVLAMWNPIKHLTTLAKILPQLALGNFQYTRETLKEIRRTPKYRDELHSLDLSTISLTDQLEKLEKEVKLREKELSRKSMFDALTNLANRRLFMERIANALAILKRDNGTFAVLFLDLDQFKKINDSLGHEQGDKLLIEVAKRLSSTVRESDTVARLGGDEFTILLTQLDDGYDATSVALKLLKKMRAPIQLNGKQHTVTTSIGIAVAPENGTDPETLLRNADLAMYKAKGMGRDNYHYYTSSMNTEAQNLLALENELRAAVDNDEFILFYQPQFDLKSGVIIGVEALLRWQSPSRGLVSPFVFMDILEDTGLIVPLGEKILKEACRQVKQWNRLNIHELRVAVNLSARQFNDPNLAASVEKVLISEGLNSRYLELEITESMLMDDIDETIETLHKLKRLGLTLSIDDFGTGYSSLSYLKQFPVDTLKVDRAFVKDIPNSESDMAITSAVIAMAHKLNLDVVAEGIETEEQVKFLRLNQCEIGQGYLFGKPQPADKITGFLSVSNQCFLGS